MIITRHNNTGHANGHETGTVRSGALFVRNGHHDDATRGFIIVPAYTRIVSQIAVKPWVLPEVLHDGSATIGVECKIYRHAHTDTRTHGHGHGHIQQRKRTQVNETISIRTIFHVTDCSRCLSVKITNSTPLTSPSIRRPTSSAANVKSCFIRGFVKYKYQKSIWFSKTQRTCQLH